MFHFSNRKYFKFLGLNKNELGERFFKIGILFLPWAVSIGGIFLLISLLISVFKNADQFIKDKQNYFILVVSLLMIISAIRQNLYYSNLSNFSFNSEIYLGLFNWLPLFISFWGFKYYLQSDQQRKNFALNLIIGSIPVLISCIGQKWLGWQTPIVFLNGLIIWFQKPLYPDSGISGLFSNPNYAAFWLVTIWPFSLYFLSKSKIKFFKIINSILVSTIFYLTIFSGSRNAFIGIIISTFFLFKLKLFLILISIVFLIIIVDVFITSINPGSLSILEKLVPRQLLLKINLNLSLDLIQYQRLEIWNRAINFILQKPLFGWGASTFPIIYNFYQGESNAQHTHNIFLQLAFDYGLLVALLFAIMLYQLFSQAIKKYINKRESIKLIDSFWISSSLVAVFFHQLDFPYFDARVSILFWILLSGINCINESKELKEIS